MSTHINDFAAGVAVFAAVSPSVLTAAHTGSAVDLVSADGPCFAVQQVGSFEEGNTWNGRIEQSADGSTGWAAVTGAAFDPVTAGSGTQVIRFARTARYVRYTATVTGPAPALSLAVLVGEARKSF